MFHPPISYILCILHPEWLSDWRQFLVITLEQIKEQTTKKFFRIFFIYLIQFFLFFFFLFISFLSESFSRKSISRESNYLKWKWMTASTYFHAAEMKIQNGIGRTE